MIIDKDDVQKTIQSFLKELNITKDNPLCGYQMSYILGIESVKIFKALKSLSRFNIVDCIEYDAETTRKVSGHNVTRRTRFYFLSL